MKIDSLVWTDDKGKLFDPYKPLYGHQGRVLTRYYMVKGEGVFPVEMLRYERSWAVSGLGNPEDSFQPERHVLIATRQPPKKPHKKRLPPDGRQWEIFNWSVVIQDVPFEDAKNIVCGVHIPGHCQRCGQKATGTTRSPFNTQIICMRCREKELRHPDLRTAEDMMRRAEKRKDKNFLGLGWKE